MIAIIGGGLTGLTAAYELTKKGLDVTLVEREKYLGGALSSYRIKDYYVESFYHHFFKNDREFFNLLSDLGLSEKVIWKNTKTAFYSDEKFYDLSGAVNLLVFGMLSFSERTRLASLALKIKTMSKKQIEKLDSVSAKEWIGKNLSPNIYSSFFEPLLRSKYGNNLNDISAAWFLERMRVRSTRGLTGEKLGYLEGGFEVFLRKLIKEIEENQGILKKNVAAKKIIIKDNRVCDLLHEKGKINADCVISTIPPKGFLSLTNMKGVYGKKMEKLEYQGCVSVLLGVDKKLTDFYWTNLMEGKTDFGALVEHTNFIPETCYAKDHIIYLASYPPAGSKIWKMNRSQIFSHYLGQLRKLLPGSDIKVKWWRVSVEKECGLVYKKGILSHIPGVETPVKGLLAGGMFNSYPERSINESIRLGKECARLAEEFEKNKC
jgi:protoporphyrinogen oxidase